MVITYNYYQGISAERWKAHPNDLNQLNVSILITKEAHLWEKEKK